jgi:hypothetical protein
MNAREVPMQFDWIIQPYIGIKDRLSGIELRFNDPRSHIRSLLGECEKSFLKSRLSVSPTDSYEQVGFHLFYDAQDRLNFIEAFPESQLKYEETSFFGMTKSELVLFSKSSDIEILFLDSASCQIDTLGISLYIGDHVEGTSVFRRGYYE